MIPDGNPRFAVSVRENVGDGAAADDGCKGMLKSGFVASVEKAGVYVK